AAGVLSLAFVEGGTGGFYTGLLVAGAGAAVFLVPMKAFLVDISPEGERGKVMSVSNLVNNLAGATAVGLQLGMRKMGAPVEMQMLGFGLLAVGATVFVMRLLPQHFWKLIALSLIRSIYRIRVRKAKNMPMEGGVVLCPNHVSFVDALVIAAASPRPVRFIMAEQCYRRKWVGKFARIFDAVPVSPQRAKDAIRVAAEEVAKGSVVCIFPEGQLTRSGAVCEVKRGFEMIARKAKCPVVPAYLHGLWGTWTSFAGGRFFGKWPRKLAAGVTVSFGEAIAPREASAERVAGVWRELARESFGLERVDQRTFSDPGLFLREEPEEWWEAVHELGEMEGGEFQELARQARELEQVSFWKRGERVLLEWDRAGKLDVVLGVLLPPMVGARVVLVPVGASDAEVAKVAREELVERLVLKAGREDLASRMAEEGREVQLVGEWRGGEHVFREGRVFPVQLAGERVVAWSLRHPNEDLSRARHSTFQPGWKSGTAGRMLPAAVIPAGWEVDGEGFLVGKGGDS
ncbi:MAG: 1-acyl-sn-glycerol-3-phosphate acyltransferase, partial [Verrucomicrobiota bacterium]